MGSPALGIALSGLAVQATIFSMVSSMMRGPEEQFRPITSTGHASRRRVNFSVDVPSRRRAVVFDAEVGDDDEIVAGDFTGGAEWLRGFR